MKTALRVALPLLTLVASCAQLPPAGTGPAGPGAPTAFVQVGQAAGHTAVLNFGNPDAPYALQQLAHRWVAADVHTYEVELKVRNADGVTFDAIGAGVKVNVAIGGAGAASKAVFGNLSHGKVYRAFVTAKGNPGGTAPTTVLNSTPATADFDFTQAQDLQSTQDKTVTVVFDGVQFSGTGNLSFGTPSPGVFINPVNNPTVTVSVPPTPTPTPTATPTPTPSPTLVGSFAAGISPQGIAIDASGNAWIGTYSGDSVTVVSPTGTTLHTYSTTNGKNTSGVAIDGNGKVWVTAPGFSGVYRYDPTTGVPTIFPVLDEGAYAIEVDAQNNVWVGLRNGKVFKLANDGSVITSFLAEPNGREIMDMAVTSAGDVWVAGYQASTIQKYSGSGQLLKTVTLPAPREMALASDDTLYVLGGFGANWNKVSADGTSIQTYDHTGLELSGLGLDGDGKLWIGNSSVVGKLRRYTTADVKEQEFTLGTSGTNYGFGQIAIDKVNRRVWKTHYYAGVTIATY